MTGSPSCHFVLTLLARHWPGACAPAHAWSSPAPNRRRSMRRTRARGEATAHYAPAEPRALGVMAILAVATILCIVLPVGIGVLVGALLAFTLYQPYRAARATHAAACARCAGVDPRRLDRGGRIPRCAPLPARPPGRRRRLGGYPRTWPAADPRTRTSRSSSVRSRLSTCSVRASWRTCAMRSAASPRRWQAGPRRWSRSSWTASSALFFMAITLYFVLRHWPDRAAAPSI